MKVEITRRNAQKIMSKILLMLNFKPDLFVRIVLTRGFTASSVIICMKSLLLFPNL